MFRVSHTPPLDVLLSDSLTSDAGAIAQHLGVSLPTLRRWQARNEAPRAALLALFYESRWGYSLLATTAHNSALYARQECEGLRRENAALRLRIKRLEGLRGFGSANEPMLKTR